jgi:5'-nucleotidase
MIRHILLSNDDGVDAYGLKLLARVLGERDDTRVTVVAPADQQSATSHSLTLRDPLRVIDYGDNRYAVTGTPTDSVLVACEHILKDDPPDAVISGVNHGSNMAQDVTYSGTVAAALEGAIYGVPSYAISCTSHRPQHWDGVETFLRGHVDNLLAQDLPRGCLLNINIPDLPANEIHGVRVARLGSRKYHDVITEQTDPRGNPYIWIGGNGPTWEPTPDTDAMLNQQGYVAITPLRVDMTHEPMIARLESLNHEGPLKR